MKENPNIKIGLIGYGAIGKQVRCLLLQNGFSKEDIFYFDDRREKHEHFYDFWSFREKRFSSLHFLPTIGYLSIDVKEKVLNVLKKEKLNIYSFVHPSAFVNPSARIGEGVIVYPKCNIDQNVVLEDGILLNNSCVISHDSVIGKNTYLSPGVVLSGFVTIGEKNFVGTGTVFSNFIKTGKGVRIGAGTCVSKDIPDGKAAIGNPVQIKENINIR